MVVVDDRVEVASVVAAVFKVAAWIALIVGVYVVLYVRANYHDSWREQLAIGGGAVFLASALAFFAYVLDLLRALVLDSRRK